MLTIGSLQNAYSMQKVDSENKYQQGSIKLQAIIQG